MTESTFDMNQIVNELARRAKIGNSLAYRHAREKMELRHANLETRVRLHFMLAQRAVAGNGGR